MKRLPFLLCFLVLSFQSVRADLNKDVRAVLHDKSLKNVEVGVAIARLGPGPINVQTIYRHDSDVPLVPASNLKLVTTAAAIDRLGPEFKFRTLLIRRGDDLVLWGDGDPALGDAELLKPAGWDVTTVFDTWARQLAALGVERINDVIVDDSVFDEVFLHPDWPMDQELRRYVAQVAGVNLNANCVDFHINAPGRDQLVNYVLNPDTRYVSIQNACVGGQQSAIALIRKSGENAILLRGTAPVGSSAPVSVTIHDPPLFAATVLGECLQRAGITVAGEAKRDRTMRSAYEAAKQTDDDPWSILAVHETPLRSVLARANKDSMNLYAESLCKRIGFETTRVSGGWESGAAAMAEFMKKIGAEPDQYAFADGSGLSKQNRVSPAALVRVLIHNFTGDNRQLFLESLAIAGIDGTLSDRFQETDLRGRVHAKSGYVRGVSALAGYLHAKDGQWYAFSIMMNGIPDGSNSTMKRLQERIVRALDDHAARDIAASR